MAQSMAFGKVLEAADQLASDEKHMLVDILHRRLAEEGRKQLAADVKEARKEFADGGCQAATADEIMQEIQS